MAAWKRGVLGVAYVLGALWGTVAVAAVPATVLVEGALVSTGGGPVADGDYDVTLHCASAEKATREVRVNGEAAKGLESVAIEPTGNWQMWKDVQLPAKVRLKKGENTLRITCLAGGLNLDEIRLAPAGG